MEVVAGRKGENEPFVNHRDVEVTIPCYDIFSDTSDDDDDGDSEYERKRGLIRIVDMSKITAEDEEEDEVVQPPPILRRRIEVKKPPGDEVLLEIVIIENVEQPQHPNQDLPPVLSGNGGQVGVEVSPAINLRGEEDQAVVMESGEVGEDEIILEEESSMENMATDSNRGNGQVAGPSSRFAITQANTTFEKRKTRTLNGKQPIGRNPRVSFVRSKKARRTPISSKRKKRCLPIIQPPPMFVRVEEASVLHGASVLAIEQIENAAWEPEHANQDLPPLLDSNAGQVGVEVSPAPLRNANGSGESNIEENSMENLPPISIDDGDTQVAGPSWRIPTPEKQLFFTNEVRLNIKGIEVRKGARYRIRVVNGTERLEEISSTPPARSLPQPRSKRVQCPKCPKMIARRNLAIHAKTHDPHRKRKFKCECGNKFFDLKNFRRHQRGKVHIFNLKRMRSVSKSECSVCKKIMAKRSLPRHRLIHFAGRTKSYKCEVCNTAFFNRWNLINHQKTRVHMKEVQSVAKRTGKKPALKLTSARRNKGN